MAELCQNVWGYTNVLSNKFEVLLYWDGFINFYSYFPLILVTVQLKCFLFVTGMFLFRLIPGNKVTTKLCGQ
jgi:hypothetical protein